MKQAWIFPSIVILCLAAVTRTAAAADDGHSKVLGSVHIEAGQHAGDATSVNGSVDIGTEAVVNKATTVNGSITMHERSTASSAITVNGSIRLEQGVRVAGEVTLVNGTISLDKEVDVGGRVTNVNGAIQLTSAHVGGGIETTTGDIAIGAGSHVEGGILVNPDRSWFTWGAPKIPRVVIGPGAVVKGALTFKREVKLYVSDRAVIGPVSGATVSKFTGERP